MTTDVELDSETASKDGETGGQDRTGEPSAADATSGENPAPPGNAKAIEPPVEAETISAPGESSGHNIVAGPPVALAPLDFAETDRLGDALSALDRKDYATAQRLFEALDRTDAAQAIRDALAALDRRDYAAAQGLFDALSLKGSAAAPARPAKPAASAAGPAASASPDKASQKPGAPRIEEIRIEEPAYRRPPRAEKTRVRSRKPILLGTALALFAVLGASVLRGAPSTWDFAAMKSQAIAGLGWAADVVKTPLGAITGQSAREEERAAIGDLRTALTQATIRLDQIEQEHGARLDKLAAHIDQDTSSATSELAARLDGLEKKAAAPAAPGPELADVAARLDRLEKKAAAAPAPAGELAAITTRLSKLEKAAAAVAVTSAQPVPPAGPKQPPLLARTEPPASNEAARPDNSKTLLRNYSVEDVQDGVALVDGRYGARQVGPGDFLPGAGRVLRIERRGGEWFVVTSQGVIGSGPGLD
jgi:hypothetical protein